MSTSFDREQMQEPIERMFEREYPAEHGVFQVVEEQTRAGSGYVHLAYAEGMTRHVHAVRSEESYAQCLTDVRAGVHALSYVDANYKWLALPLDAFRAGEEEMNGVLETICAERGFGILTVQTKGLGVSAKVILDPRLEAGRHITGYRRLREELREELRAS